MELTNQHIDQLYLFTKQHFVEHYDVQTELVDHLANNIEHICNSNPALTFEEARDIAFKKFGVFGFMEIVQEKQKHLGKKYRKIVCTYAKEWFSLPKILITLSMFLFFNYILQLSIGTYIVMPLVFSLATCSIFLVMKLKKVFRERTKQNGKKWMLEELIFNIASFGGILVITNIPQIINYTQEIPSMVGRILISLLLTLTIIYLYITLIIIPKQADYLLEKEYPSFKIN